VDLLAAHTMVFPSKGEAKKMIIGGGVAINKVKIPSAEAVYQTDTLINNKYLVAQKGKKNYYLIVAE
ncbi:MAG: tyrosine--tRNA ligase, partial [Bacteroidota bacterium]|nr:tyrosine--tRNA ligase [Bacteroidota bacterium]